MLTLYAIQCLFSCLHTQRRFVARLCHCHCILIHLQPYHSSAFFEFTCTCVFKLYVCRCVLDDPPSTTGSTMKYEPMSIAINLFTSRLLPAPTLTCWSWCFCCCCCCCYYSDCSVRELQINKDYLSYRERANF